MTTLLLASIGTPARGAESAPDPSELELPDDLDLVMDRTPTNDARPELALDVMQRPQSPGGVRFPPLRTESSIGLRQGSNPSFNLEVGSEVLRKGRWTVETGVAYGAGRTLAMVGPRRSYLEGRWFTDLQWSVDRWLTAGPSVGLSVRNFRQNWRGIATTAMPVLGLRGVTGLIGSRTWRLSLNTRVNVDLLPTRMVLDTAEVQTLSRVELALGLRWQFGSPIPPGVGR